MLRTWLVHEPGAQGPEFVVPDAPFEVPRRTEYASERQAMCQAALAARRIGDGVPVWEWVPGEGYRKVAVAYPSGILRITTWSARAAASA